MFENSDVRTRRCHLSKDFSSDTEHHDVTEVKTLVNLRKWEYVYTKELLYRSLFILTLQYEQNSPKKKEKLPETFYRGQPWQRPGGSWALETRRTRTVQES